MVITSAKHSHRSGGHPNTSSEGKQLFTLMHIFIKCGLELGTSTVCSVVFSVAIALIVNILLDMSLRQSSGELPVFNNVSALST